jgi:hypothetical protein
MSNHRGATTPAMPCLPGAHRLPGLLLLVLLPACSGNPVAPRNEQVCLPLANGFSGNVAVTFQSGYEAKGGLTYEIVRGNINDLSVNATAPAGSSAELRLTVTSRDSIRILPVNPAMMGKTVLLRVRARGRLEQTVGFANWSRVEARVGSAANEHLWLIASNQNTSPLLEIDEVRYLSAGAPVGEWMSFFTLVTLWAASGSSTVTVANSSAIRVEILDAAVWDNLNPTLSDTVAIRQICSASGAQYLGG